MQIIAPVQRKGRTAEFGGKSYESHCKWWGYRARVELGATVAIKSSHKLSFCLRVKSRKSKHLGDTLSYYRMRASWTQQNIETWKMHWVTKSTQLSGFSHHTPIFGHCCFASFLIQHLVKKTSLKEWDVESSFPSLGKMIRCGLRMYAQSTIIANLYFLHVRFSPLIQQNSKQLLEKHESESSFSKRNNWIIGDKIRKIFFPKP